MITSRMLPRQLTLPPHPPAKLSPSPSCSCSLFSLFFALPSFRINHLQPLFAKHPGWGYLGVSSLLESITSSLFFQNAPFASRSDSWTLGGSRRRLPVPEMTLRDTPDSYRARRSGGGTVPPRTALESTLAKVYQNK